MNELTITTNEELMAWHESRKDHTDARYYSGDIACMNGELYTIADIMHDAEPAWFEDGEVSTVYELENKAFYACHEEDKYNGWDQFHDSAKEAIEDAIYTWNHLTYKEKKDNHVEAIFSIAYIEGQALNSCWPLWKDGELVDPSEYEGINVNAEGRKAAEIIRKYMEEGK